MCTIWLPSIAAINEFLRDVISINKRRILDVFLNLWCLVHSAFHDSESFCYLRIFITWSSSQMKFASHFDVQDRKRARRSRRSGRTFWLGKRHLTLAIHDGNNILVTFHLCAAYFYRVRYLLPRTFAVITSIWSRVRDTRACSRKRGLLRMYLCI